jgi:hypothetical protein
MCQAENHEIVSVYLQNDAHLQLAGRDAVKRFISAMVMNPDASSSIASEMGCSRPVMMYLIAHASVTWEPVIVEVLSPGMVSESEVSIST